MKPLRFGKASVHFSGERSRTKTEQKGKTKLEDTKKIKMKNIDFLRAEIPNVPSRTVQQHFQCLAWCRVFWGGGQGIPTVVLYVKKRTVLVFVDVWKKNTTYYTFYLPIVVICDDVFVFDSAFFLACELLLWNCYKLFTTNIVRKMFPCLFVIVFYRCHSKSAFF